MPNSPESSAVGDRRAHSAAPAATSVYYYLSDILGSVLALADAAGNVVERYGKPR